MIEFASLIIILGVLYFFRVTILQKLILKCNITSDCLKSFPYVRLALADVIQNSTLDLENQQTQEEELPCLNQACSSTTCSSSISTTTTATRRAQDCCPEMTGNPNFGKMRYQHHRKSYLPGCTLNLQKIDQVNRMILNSYKDSAKYINYDFIQHQEKLRKTCSKIRCNCKQRGSFKNYARFQRTVLPQILEEVAY